MSTCVGYVSHMNSCNEKAYIILHIGKQQLRVCYSHYKKWYEERMKRQQIASQYMEKIKRILNNSDEDLYA